MANSIWLANWSGIDRWVGEYHSPWTCVLHDGDSNLVQILDEDPLYRSPTSSWVNERIGSPCWHRDCPRVYWDWRTYIYRINRREIDREKEKPREREAQHVYTIPAYATRQNGSTRKGLCLELVRGLCSRWSSTRATAMRQANEENFSRVLLASA